MASLPNIRRLDLLRQIAETEQNLAGLYAELVAATREMSSSNQAAAGRKEAVFPAAIRIAAKWYQVTDLQILGRDKQKDVAEARQVAMWLLTRIGLSTKAIGRHFSRDHSTVVYAGARVRQLEESYPKLASKLQAMQAEFLAEMNAMGQMVLPLAP